MSKPHSVTVSIVSESDGVVNQEVALKEYAADAEELIMKNHIIADAVVDALQAVTKVMSQAYIDAQKVGSDKKEEKQEEFVR